MNTRNSSERDDVLASLDSDLEAHVSRLQRYIRQPSVSAYNDGITETVTMFADELRSLGGTADIVDGVDFPIVYARFESGAKRTVLIHGMYDTVPAKSEGWVAPPFEARRMTFGDLGECIVGRGAEDTKGPLASVLSMIAAHRAAGVPLPVNLILVFEASEMASASLPAFVESHLPELRKADVAYWPWHTQRANGTPVAWLGVKGNMMLRLRVRAGDWGGPVGGEAHGLHGIWVANPVFRLVTALASLKSADEREILLDGFYDPVRPPSAEEEALVADLARRVDPESLLKEAHAKRFKYDTLLDALRAYCFRTEINVSGIQGGIVMEHGHKTELPDSAVAALDIRPLDGMSVEHIVACLRRHFDSTGFPEVEIEVVSGYSGGAMPPSNWAVQALLDTYKEGGLDPEVWPRTSTAIASHLFIETVGIPWIATTLGHSGNKHAANEYLQVKGYRDAIDFIVRLMWRLSEAEPDRKD
ncbi:MAG: M20/M25/M40 family metallo-hydrolase [Alphaproteobacteria bacterium]